MNPTDGGLLILRVVVGLTIIAHGVNHARNLESTAKWFAKIGFRAGPLQARLSALVEIGAGTMLVVGLLTPLAAAAVVATMTVAIGSIHKFNGFFIFRPGEGWEYTNVLAWVSFAIAWMGPGAYSFDHILVMDWTGVLGFLIGVGGFLAGIAHLGIFWRRTPQSERS